MYQNYPLAFKPYICTNVVMNITESSFPDLLSYLPTCTPRGVDDLIRFSETA